MKAWGLLVCGLVSSAPSLAQFEIDRFAIANGGGQSAGGAWSLSGTLGQSDAYVVPLCSADGAPTGSCEGATFELVGGFWAGMTPPAPPPSCADLAECIFRDGFEIVP